MSPARAKLRSIDITGVMPLPAVTKSNRAGRISGSTNRPLGWLSRTIPPGRSRRTTCRDTNPPGPAFTVMVTRPSGRPGGDDSENVRQCHTPAMSTPTLRC